MSHNLNDEYELCSFLGLCFDFDSYLIGKDFLIKLWQDPNYFTNGKII